MKIVFGVLVIVAALALVVVVLLQSGKDKSLSNALAGGSSDTYYGKNKSKGIDKMLNKITAVVAAVFALIVLVYFIIQPESDVKDIFDQDDDTSVTTVADVTTVAGDETTAGEVTTADAGTTECEVTTAEEVTTATSGN
ncbi:MAG: preprotein translocase subunit SecG [Firmicutes bacterium]|nr:preprotein translocase subunit SecG [Candidatus Colimorpha enterica]